jgi:protein required for attachment to host cells
MHTQDADSSSAAALVLVADSVRAQVFEAKTPTAPLREAMTLLNPDGRSHERDLVSDRGGQRNNRPTQGAASALGGHSAKAHRAEHFAAFVCRRVAGAMTRHSARRLYVIAEPQFLGLLRMQMDRPVCKRLAGEVPKSLVGRPHVEIRGNLPARL